MDIHFHMLEKLALCHSLSFAVSPRIRREEPSFPSVRFNTLTSTVFGSALDEHEDEGRQRLLKSLFFRPSRLKCKRAWRGRTNSPVRIRLAETKPGPAAFAQLLHLSRSNNSSASCEGQAQP